MSSIDLLTIDCATVDEFLQLLTPASDRWEPDPNSWIFRGQADSDWSLVPSILRMNSGTLEWERQQERCRVRMKILDTLDPHGKGNERLSVEWALVDEFVRAADIVGLQIPEDTQFRRNRIAVHSAMLDGVPAGKGGWPHASWLSATALAQHYGIPTRLLDWSMKPRVAAYFAAIGAVGPRPVRLAVWCLDSNLLLLGTPMLQRQQRPVLATAPYHGNSNLAAQAGVFTVDYDAIGPDRPFEKFVIEHLRLAVGNKSPTEWGVSHQPFVKVTLPGALAPELLRKLAHDHVSAATVFPGYTGVVKSLQEQQSWDKRPWDAT